MKYLSGSETTRMNPYLLQERLFRLLFSVYLIFYGLMRTRLAFSYPTRSAMFFMVPSVLLVCWQILAHRKERKIVAASVLITGIYCLSYVLNAGDKKNMGTIILAGFLSAAAIGIGYEKILKTWSVAIGLLLSVTFLSASIGAAQNLVYFVGEDRLVLRGSLGIGYPTDCASWVLFFTMFLWAAWKRIPDEVMTGIAALAAAFAKLYCDSNTSYYCALLFVAVMLFYMFETRVLQNTNYVKWVKKAINICILLLPFVLTVLAFFFTFSYGEGKDFAYQMNMSLHDRLNLNWSAIQQYGISAFGNNFRMYGSGGSLLINPRYNFVDCTYINVPVRNGVVFSVFLLCLWTAVWYQAVRRDDRRLLYVMAIIALHSFIEHHFLDAMYNPLLLLPLADFRTVTQPTTEHAAVSKAATVKPGLLKQNAGLLAGICMACVCMLFLRGFFSRMRTVVDLTTTSSGEVDLGISLAMVFLLIGAMACLVTGAAKTAQLRAEGSNLRRGCIFLAAGCALGAVLAACCGIVINKQQETVAASIETDSEALDVIFAANEDPVYADYLPAVYRKRYPNLKNTFLSGDDLARHQNATVIVNKTMESNCFLNRGYLFAQISDTTALYSTDISVIHALQDAGYHVTGFYSVPRSLTVDEEGLVETQELFGAQYLAHVEVELLNAGGQTDEGIGAIRITPYDGADAVSVTPVYLSDFSDQTIQKEIYFYVGDAPETRFQLDCAEGYEMRIRSVRLERHPDTDTHNYYNEQYQVVRSEYYDPEGNRIYGEDGSAALSYEYDAAGNRNVIRYYDLDYQPLTIRSGYAEIHYVYDDLRRVVKESYYDTEGEPKRLSYGEAGEERVLDTKGNVLVSRYLGPDGELTMITSGYAEMHREFDGNDRLVRESFFGKDGEPVTRWGSCQSVVYTYDENGNQILIQYLGKEDDPANTVYGYAQISRTYNDENRMIQEEYLDESDRPVESIDGFQAVEKEYDPAGHIVREKYLDRDGHPVMSNNGYAIMKHQYDEAGRVVKTEYFDTEEKPVAAAGTGTAAVHYTYDNRNRVTEEAYFGPDGAPAPNHADAAVVKTTYTDKGSIESYSYFGTDGQPVAITGGYARVSYEYDFRGKWVSEYYYDVEGNPTACMEGYFGIELEYDAEGREAVRTTVDSAGNPVASKSLFARTETTYDAYGRVYSIQYYDAEGVLTNHNTGYAECRREYDLYGRCIRETYHDENGNPVKNSSGIAGLNRVYNELNHVVMENYFDENGDMVNNNAGISEVTRNYNERDRLVSLTQQNTDGTRQDSTGYASVRYEYDERGLQTADLYADSNGSPVFLKEGYAKIRYGYDEIRRYNSDEYLDLNDEPVTLSNGYAGVKRSHTGRLCTEECFVDEAGHPVMHAELGYAYVRYEYDQYRNRVSESYYDINGEPVTASQGYQGRRMTYDENRKLVEETTW